MLTLRRSEERGRANHDWLDSHHTFSFASYYDPEHMGFSSLRVLNDDRVDPSSGFPTHSHNDMEIISFVLEGTMEHKDSMGNGAVMQAGEVQVMTAGTGVTHSEFNASTEEPLRFLQIWITPDQKGLQPDYQQPHIEPGAIDGKLYHVASKNPTNGTAKINQNADIYISQLRAQDQVEHKFKPDRKGWLQVAKGSLTLGDLELNEGDGVAITDEDSINLTTPDEALIMLFDLA